MSEPYNWMAARSEKRGGSGQDGSGGCEVRAVSGVSVRCACEAASVLLCWCRVSGCVCVVLDTIEQFFVVSFLVQREENCCQRADGWQQPLMTVSDSSQRTGGSSAAAAAEAAAGWRVVIVCSYDVTMPEGWVHYCCSA